MLWIIKSRNCDITDYIIKEDRSKFKGRDTRCDKLWRHITATLVASSPLLLRQVACPYFVAVICRTNSNQFEFVRQIAATMIFTCHMRRFVAATCRSDVSQRFVASCVSALRCVRCPKLRYSLKCSMQNCRMEPPCWWTSLILQYGGQKISVLNI